jgi:phosphoserine phosphatase
VLQPRGAAFFDLDKTLMAGSSGLHWARAARSAKLLSRRQMLRYGWQNVKFRLQGSTDAATDQVKAEVADMIRGRRVVDFQRMTPKVLAGVLPRLYPQMLEAAYAHQDAGRPVYIVTAASQEMAEMMAHVLSFDGAIGARSEVVDGVYTGRPGGPVHLPRGQGRGAAPPGRRGGLRPRRELRLLRLGVRPADAARRWAIPVAVNPDAELARVAREEGWSVMRFDQLGRKLIGGAALVAAALVGTAGRTVHARRLPR